MAGSGYYRLEANLLQGLNSQQSAATQQPGGYGGLASAGNWLSIGGALLGLVGSFYAAKSQQNQLKSEALAADFQESMSAINAKNAESDAQSILQAGQDEGARTSLAYGQEKAAQKAEQGASGFTIGVGSAAEAQASIELAKRLDLAAINRNTVRAASSRRLQATDQRNQSLLAGVSARNLRGTASSISPGLAAAGSLFRSAGPLLGQYASSHSSRY